MALKEIEKQWCEKGKKLEIFRNLFLIAKANLSFAWMDMPPCSISFNTSFIFSRHEISISSRTSLPESADKPYRTAPSD
jgi:hypothetical protein